MVHGAQEVVSQRALAGAAVSTLGRSCALWRRQALDEQARDKLSHVEQKRSELAELEQHLGRG